MVNLQRVDFAYWWSCIGKGLRQHCLPMTRPPAQASLTARQLWSLEQLCRHQGAGSALLQAELCVSLGQKISLAMDRAATWGQGEGGLGPALAALLAAAPSYSLPFTERRQLVATAVTLHSLQPPGPGQGLEGGSRNPLRMRRVLGASSRPATLYRLLS